MEEGRYCTIAVLSAVGISTDFMGESKANKTNKANKANKANVAGMKEIPAPEKSRTHDINSLVAHYFKIQVAFLRISIDTLKVVKT